MMKRTMGQKVMCITILLLMLAAAGCTKAPASDAADSERGNKVLDQNDTRDVSGKGFLVGVAGLVPSRYPNPKTEDWNSLFSSIPSYGGLFGDYVEWNDTLEKGVPAQMRLVAALSEKYAFTPVYALGFKNVEKGFFPSEAYRNVVMRTVSELKPRYLGLGVEVNVLYEKDPADFERFVSQYLQLYDEIKNISPETRVFPIFQLEYLKGKGALSGEARKDEWFLLGKFEGKMDLAAFTTYPVLDYQDPASIPVDYYEVIRSHTNKRIAFTEMGWPSANSPGRASTEEVQAAFLARFKETTKNLDKEFMIWTLPYDKGGTDLFASIALKNNDGTPKKAFAEWGKISREKANDRT